MAEHHFYLKANWPGLRNDVGTIETLNLKTEVSIPTEMDGPGIGTNPDEMLLGAAATCYIITLAAMMERSGVEKESLSMESIGVVDYSNGVVTYKKIIHKPNIVLAPGMDGKRSIVERLTMKAETSCMISRALQGNVEVTVEPIIKKQ
ncbi:OsmC family protein [Sporosarcina sp. ACRSL]|uniref:OsmC family protein n=1 Tax=Sporosarcina sp. ACRSL TaxID=2918215 RepID=UPI001EF52CBD|nr:OsmC family protein [Sporosarcina sp. ACRSL]MCG7345402.1 OsmC family protein [Sporosarcina sp. ACRSL]